MSITKQHQIYQNRLDLLSPELPPYVQEFIIKKTDTLSSITLFNYAIEIYRFLGWLTTYNNKEYLKFLNDTVPNKELTIKDFPLIILEKIDLEFVEDYFKFLAKEELNAINNKKITAEEEKVLGIPKKKRNKNSINKSKSALRSLYKYLSIESEDKKTKEPLIRRNVMLKIPVTKIKETLDYRSNKINGKILQPGQDLKFIDFVRNKYPSTLSERQLAYFNRDKERDIAILMVFLTTGIRVNELVHLKISDVNFENQTLSVLRKGALEGTAVITRSGLDAIRDYLHVRSSRYNISDKPYEYLFVNLKNNVPSPLAIRSVEEIVYKYTAAFGKRMSPHKLRHSFATLMAEETNGNLNLIMNQLGHSSTETSILYVNSTKKELTAFAKKLDDRVLEDID